MLTCDVGPCYDRVRNSVRFMISAVNLTKGFGDQLLFREANFTVGPRERVGLVGRNGHGKTTLFRLIIGDELPDGGRINRPKGYKVGYVRQQLAFSESTLLEEGAKGLPEGDEADHWKVEKILFGLGFTEADMALPPGRFSGGYQVRLNLAKVLVSEPDLLLLDEPTNYLDITSIRWIENFLIGWPHEVMLITHDRTFMDKIVTHTMGIHRKMIRKIAGDTEKLYTQIAYEEEIHEKTRANDERRRKKLEVFISRFRAKARLANLVQSRIKTLEKTHKPEKLEQIKSLDFSFRSQPTRGKQCLGVRDISFSYNGHPPLIRNLDISVTAGDRLCVIGSNGRGKTTLLKLMAGILQPQSGEVVFSPGIRGGVFEQTNLSTLNNDRTVEEEILYSHPDLDRQSARNICGNMMFEGDDALKTIAVLSGGEKSRVMLGKLLATPVNLLLLDEPTNHLDMYTCDALLEALDSFDGTVVMVTHNEMFLHALAERLIVFQHGAIRIFEGTYQRFVESGGWEEDEILYSPSEEKRLSKPSEQATRLTKKARRQKRSEIISERGSVLGPLQKRISKVEDEIEAQEKRLAELSEEMIEASQTQDAARIEKLSYAIHTGRPVVEELFEELENLTTELDGAEARFEERLRALEVDGS